MVGDEDLALWENEFEEWRSTRRSQIKRDALVIMWTLIVLVGTGALMTVLVHTRF